MPVAAREKREVLSGSSGGNLIKDTAKSDYGTEPVESDTTPDQEYYILRLYVAGQTKRSLTAFANLEPIRKVLLL
jgi:hypothetical protein